MRRLFPFFAVLVCCAHLPAQAPAPIPLEPTIHVLQFDPPPVYVRWWRLAERCSGLAGDMNRVTWYVASSGTLYLKGDSSAYDGMYYADTERVVFALLAVADSAVVIHESLHALQDQNRTVKRGEDAHQPVIAQRCGRLIGPMWK